MLTDKQRESLVTKIETCSDWEQGLIARLSHELTVDIDDNIRAKENISIGGRELSDIERGIILNALSDYKTNLESEDWDFEE